MARRTIGETVAIAGGSRSIEIDKIMMLYCRNAQKKTIQKWRTIMQINERQEKN